MAGTPRALAGLRVLELATGVGGPYCGKLFAGLGAEVIKVEPPGADPTRREGPFPGDVPDPERSGLFLHLNTGKRSIVLDLQVGQDRRTFAGLLARADVLLLSHGPSELRVVGIDLDEVQRRFPRVVITDVTSFGLTGPYAEYLGGELIAYALSGYMILTGAPDREPIKSYGSLVEYEAGAHAALGTLAALFARERDGRGQLVDVSAMEAGTFMLGGVEQPAYFYHRVARRNGTRLLGFAPEHSYPSTIRPCKDGYVHAHSNNRHLDLLGALIPNPRLLEPNLLATMMGHADEIDAIMDAWLADKDRVEVVRRAQQLRLPFTEVMAPSEVMANAHHRARGSFVTVEHPVAGPILQPGAPFVMHGTPWRAVPAPPLGQHAEQVRAEVLATAEPISEAPAAPDDRPLRGVRVIDFTNAVAGPIASFILGDLGAEVIKIEASNGRPVRPAGTAPLVEGAEDRGYDRMLQFNELNHAKRSLVLDVAKPEGRAAFLDLVKIADVVVENFAPRVMPNLQLDYERLRAVRPDIIAVSMPAFGLSGPYRDRISYGPGVDAMSGFSHLTGYPDGPPMKPGNFFCDQNAGVHSAFATLAALWHRRRTGAGQQVELAMIEGEFQILGDAYIDYAMNGRERFRSGNDHPWMAPHGVFRCAGARESGGSAPAINIASPRGLGGSAPGSVADRGAGWNPERASQTLDDAWVAIGVENDEQWRSLCALMHRPDLAADPRFASVEARHANRRLLDAPITLWTEQRSQHEAQEALQAAGVPAGAAMNAFELLYDPHVRARHGFDYVTVPNVGPTPYPRIAFLLSRTPVPIERPAPAFAEANDYALHDLLGMNAVGIAALEERRITTRVPLG
jgi:crotonobetainyl-CoA:carnitine CoA-transferase CaiB-like acyl-CoA transferase